MANQNNSTNDRPVPQALLDTFLVFNEILQERERQNAKWGEQNHSDEVWALILGEEFGELQKAILERAHAVSGNYIGPLSQQPDEQVHTELIHVAAVAYQWLEAMQRRERRYSSAEAQQRRADADALFNVGPDA